MKRIIMTVLAGLIISAGAFAQVLPVGDGMLAKGEYPISKEGSGMTVGIAVSPDGKTLYMALQAPTDGWVSIGLGSLKMNGAYMVIAFDSNGTQTVSEQTGKGHSHSPNADKKLLSSAVKESGGVTTLEFAVPAAGYLEGNSLKLLAAYGKKDNLTSIHSKYYAVEVPLTGSN